MNIFRSEWAIGVLLIAATVLAMGGGLFFDFVNYDDGMYVYDNPPVLGGLSPQGLQYAFTTTDSGNYIALTWLSYELDSSISHLIAPKSSLSQVSGTKYADRLVNPTLFHFTNLLLHIINVLLLFSVLKRISDQAIPSAIVALLFAIHPMHVESVVWVAERKDVLSTALMLLTIRFYIEYAAKPTWTRYGVVALLLLLGLSAKPMLVTLPIVLLALDLFVLHRWQRASRSEPPVVQPPAYSQRTLFALCLEKPPLLAEAFLCGLATIYAQSTTNAFKLSDQLPLWLRLGHAVNSYGWHLVSTFWPIGLSPLYIHPVQYDPNWNPLGLTTFATIFAIALITWLIFRMKPPRDLMLFGWLWFLVTLLPVVGIIHVGDQAYADRYSYVPHIGLFIALVWSADRLYSRLPQSTFWKSATVAIVAVALVVITRQQTAIWKDTGTLWERAVQADPRNFVAHEGLSLWYQYLKKYDLAAKHSLELVKLRPNESTDEPHRFLGWYYQTKSDWNRSDEQFQKAIEKSPDHAVNWYKWGEMQAAKKDHAAAIKSFSKADELEPNNPEVQTYLGISYASLKQLNEARRHFEAAVTINPQSPRYLINLGSCLEQSNEIPAAISSYERVLKIDPKNTEALRRLFRLTNTETRKKGTSE